MQEDNDGRNAKLFLEAARDDADNARVPALARKDSDGAVMLCRRHGFGRVLYRCLDRPALLLEDIELHGYCAGFFRIFRCQQTDAKVGFSAASPLFLTCPPAEAE